MNLLLITFSFPPAGGVGVLRALSLAKYLPAEGIRVDVLTARNAPAVGRDLDLLSQVPADVTVHRTWTLDLPFALRKGVKRMLGGPKGDPAPASPAAPAPAGAHPAAGSSPEASPGTNPLRRLVANLLLPDPQIGWLPFALPAARRIIRRRHIDAVLITVPPFSSAALVTRLRRSFPSLPIVLDFRDEWLSTTLDLVSYNNNRRAREVARRTESDAVHSATGVVLVTEAAQRELQKRYPDEAATKFVCIENGYDREPVGQMPSAARTGGMLHSPPKPLPAVANDRPALFTYIGTVYGSTDPKPLIAAVEQLPPELRRRLHLRFIGHIERGVDRAALERLGPTVELRAFVPQAEALRAMADTDWLLLITHDRINVAAKFYDYLSGGKPIFAAVHPEGDVRRLLEQTGAGVWADSRNVDAIARLFTSVLRGETPAAALPVRKPDQVARFHRRTLTRRYARFLRQMANAPAQTTAAGTAPSFPSDPAESGAALAGPRSAIASSRAPVASPAPVPGPPAELRR